MIKLKYFDTIRMLLRSGKVGDEFVQKTQQVKIVLGKAQLEEVPDFQYHVRIKDYFELSESAYQRQKHINDNQFYVNYENGMIYFNETQEGKIVSIDYKGRGVIQYPAERIYVNNTEFDLREECPYVIDNLQEFIDFLVRKTKEFRKFVKDKEDELTRFVNDKVDYMTLQILKFESYVQDKFSEFVDYVDEFMNLADDKIHEMDRHIILCETQTKECEKQTEECEKATQESIESTKECVLVTNDTRDMCESYSELYEILANDLDCAEQEMVDLKKAELATRLMMKEPVKTKVDIDTTYPNPEIGWGVQCMDNGDIYRWDGQRWHWAYNLQATMAQATEQLNGIMTKEMVKKLNGIDDKAQVNYINEKAKDVLPDYFKTRTIIFVLSGDIMKGNQGVYIQAPFNGKITGIRAFCKTAGSSDTIIKVEKASESDFLSEIWENIFEENGDVIIENGKKTCMSYQLNNTQVTKNDYFRVFIDTAGLGVKDVTVQVDVLI